MGGTAAGPSPLQDATAAQVARDNRQMDSHATVVLLKVGEQPPPVRNLVYNHSAVLAEWDCVSNGEQEIETSGVRQRHQHAGVASVGTAPAVTAVCFCCGQLA